jgi:hypothetical protein
MSVKERRERGREIAQREEAHNIFINNVLAHIDRILPRRITHPCLQGRHFPADACMIPQMRQGPRPQALIDRDPPTLNTE